MKKNTQKNSGLWEAWKKCNSFISPNSKKGDHFKKITRVICNVEFKNSKNWRRAMVWMVRRSIISFNNAILVFVDRDKTGFEKLRRERWKCYTTWAVVMFVLLFHHPDILSQWSNLRSDPKLMEARIWLCCVLCCA